MVTYFAVLLVVIGIGYAIAFTRKGSVRSASMGGRVHEVRTPASPEQAFAAIARLGHPYKCDDQDPNSKILVMSSPVTFFSWGFMYPVFIHAEGSGARIQIGIHSKFIQMGPIVGNAHDKLLNAINIALSVPAARVA
jgi:hypothetical protein